MYLRGSSASGHGWSRSNDSHLGAERWNTASSTYRTQQRCVVIEIPLVAAAGEWRLRCDDQGKDLSKLRIRSKDAHSSRFGISTRVSACALCWRTAVPCGRWLVRMYSVCRVRKIELLSRTQPRSSSSLYDWPHLGSSMAFAEV